MKRIFTVALLVAALALPAAPARAQDDLTAKVNTGWTALQKGDTKTARQSFQEVVDASPVYDFGWYALGMTASREGKFDEAIGHFTEAIEINPDKFEYHYGLAAAYRSKEDYAKAIATLNNAETKADQPQTQYYLHLERGLSYLSMKQWDRASTDLAEAVKLQPADPMANQRYGMALYRQEEYGKALQHLQKAATSNSKDYTTMIYLARSAINLGQREADSARKLEYYAQAVKAGQAAVAAKPGFETQYTLARAYLGAGQYEQAARSFQKVLTEKPKYCAAMVNLGQSYIGMQAWPQASESMSKAVDCDPKNTFALNTLAFAYVKESKREEALAAYEKSYGLKADPKIAERIELVKQNIQIAQENAAIENFNEEEKARMEAEKAEFEKRMAEFEAEQKKIQEYKDKDE